MKNNNLIKLLPLVLLVSCLPNVSDEPPINLYLKKIKLKDAEVQWYYDSLISSIPPDWVVIKYSDVRIDTLCQAENISDVITKGTDSIAIIFSSIPLKYNKPTVVKHKSTHYFIETDTTGHPISTEIRYQHTFKDSVTVE